jgi:hypothetical protein
LHRSLAEAAEHEGVSLNQYVLSLLSRRDSRARIERRLKQLSEQIEGCMWGNGSLSTLEVAVEDMPASAKDERARMK